MTPAACCAGLGFGGSRGAWGEAATRLWAWTVRAGVLAGDGGVCERALDPPRSWGRPGLLTGGRRLTNGASEVTPRWLPAPEQPK